MSWVEERLRKSFIETIERMRSEKTLLERVVANRNEVEIIKEDDELWTSQTVLIIWGAKC